MSTRKIKLFLCTFFLIRFSHSFIIYSSSFLSKEKLNIEPSALEAEINKLFDDFVALIIKPVNDLRAKSIARIRAQQTPEQTILEEIKEGSI